MRITQEGIQGNFLGEDSVPFCDTGVLPRWLSDEKSAYRSCKRCGFNPWVRKIPWRRKWQPTPVFLPGGSHGQRSLVGYSPRGRRVSHDLMTKQEHTYLSIIRTRIQQEATQAERTGFEAGVRGHSVLCSSPLFHLNINVTDVLFSSINCKYNK